MLADVDRARQAAKALESELVREQQRRAESFADQVGLLGVGSPGSCGISRTCPCSCPRTPRPAPLWEGLISCGNGARDSILAA